MQKYYKVCYNKGSRSHKKVGETMAKRLSFEDVKKEFENKGLELLETEYVNNVTKMRYRCPKHPDENLSSTYQQLRVGRGCSHCAYRGKLTLPEVKERFEERGYKLLETKYVGNLHPMRYECPEHPDKELSIRVNDLKKGHGCPHCSGKLSKLDFETARVEFVKKGYRLLETKYINNSTKMRYECPNHPEKETCITYKDLKFGYGCGYCWAESIKGENNKLWRGGVTKITKYLREELKDWKNQALAKYGYKCALSKENKGDLQIHHAKSFHLIRDEVLKELNLDKRDSRMDYSIGEMQDILARMKKKHGEALGIPLKKDIHLLFHEHYGYGDNTLKQFHVFKERWEKGEFDEVTADV